MVQKEQIDENPIAKTDSLFAQINTDSLAQVNANNTKSASSELYGKWQDVLSKVNGSFVIDFGKSENQTIEKIQKELEQDMDIVEVMTINGENKLITPQAQDKVNAERIIKKLESKGIEAILVQVKDGELIPAKSIEELKSNEPTKDLDIRDKYDDFENNYVVKIGTIDDKTTLAERGKLINAPQSIQVMKSNGSIDVISKSISKNEEDAYQSKANHISLGFDSSKVAYFKDGKVEVIRKEELEGKYTVSMGSFKTNITNDQVNNILSLPDIESIETHNPEMTTYVLGTYDSPEDAKKRVEDLVKKGLNPAIVKIKNGKIKELELNVVFDDIGIKNLTTLKENAKQVKTDEVVFRVQLGAYRSKIDMNIFQGVNTLSFPTSEGVTKYVTGSFITYQQAYIHKIDMRRMGFSGSFVVAYKDGKRIKVTDLVNQEKYKKVKESVSPIEKELDKINDVAMASEIKNIESSESPEVLFKVQIGAYKGDEMTDKLAQFPNLEMEIYGKYKRYISGNFLTYLEADNHKKEIAEKGFGEACVVAYNDGQRVETPGSKSNIITQDDLSNKIGDPTEPSVISTYQLNKVSIMVQVGLFRGEIPAELNERYSALPDLTKQVTNYGVIRYMTGDFKNTSEAAAYKEELIKTGFPDAFLVAYYANQRVTMQEIVEILKKAK
jgi:cell division protein FtsN